MNKRRFSPKVLTIVALCLVCVAVVVGILCWKAAPAPAFTPDADANIEVTDKWEDNADASTTGDDESALSPFDDTQANGGASDSTDDTYNVISESDKGVVIEMTPPAEKPKAPDVPAGQKPNTDNSIPETPAAGGDCVPSTPNPPEPSQPGRVYDPVFGWMEPTPAEGEVIDNDGDPNKMVGNMG